MRNQKGISMIALIITIIVIIILAAIVIGSAVNTPEQANWAKFCGNYAEIQSAVASKTAEVYGEIALNPAINPKPSMEQIRAYVCTQNNPGDLHGPSATVADEYDTSSDPDGMIDWPRDGKTYLRFNVVAGKSNYIPILNNSNQLGIDGFTFEQDSWVINNKGLLFYAPGMTNPSDTTSDRVYYGPTSFGSVSDTFDISAISAPATSE
jgi:type II secretory pathway pseudopilin PulG